MKTLIRLLLKEQSDLGLHCLPRPICPKTLDHYGNGKWEISKLFFSLQGDIGPFSPGLPIDIPLWMAVNLKQRQKARIRPPDWMDVG